MTSSTDGFEPRTDSRPDDVAWGQVRWPVDPHTVLALGEISLALATDDDAPAIFAALDHDACWAHVRGRPASVDEVRETIRSATASGRWMWIVRERGEVVGTTSFLDVSAVDARLEIGFTLYTPSVWGTAVNPTCKLILMGWAFDTAGFGRVQMKTDVRNARSQRAIASLGAIDEGVLRRYQRRQDDTVRDTVMFSVIAEEWPTVKARLEARLA
jgi:RimJ/RimL family protein N-acetyltransferase